MARFALVLFMIMAPLVHGDEIESQINLGIEAYKEGDLKGAIDELQFAVAQLREKLNAEQSSLLPEPLDGWSAGDIENTSAAMAMMGGGTHMSRKYTKDKATIELSIVANSMMMAGIMAMINNPMLLNSSDGMSPYRFKRTKGTKKVNGKEIEITLALAGQIMIQLQGRGVTMEDMEAYLAAMDLKVLKSELIQ